MDVSWYGVLIGPMSCVEAVRERARRYNTSFASLRARAPCGQGQAWMMSCRSELWMDGWMDLSERLWGLLLLLRRGCGCGELERLCTYVGAG